MSDAMTNEQAALWLDDMHTRLAKYEPLPEKLAPDSIAAAYAVQSAFVRRMQMRGLRSLGAKIALSSPQMQEMVGINHPVGGTIVGAEIQQSPARIRASQLGRVCIECEVAVRLGKTLDPADGPFSDEDIAGAVDACAAAFEIADDRNADYTSLDALNMIADNAWNAGIIIGDVVTDFDAASLADADAVLHVNGEKVGEGKGSDAMGHPFNSLKFLANEWASHGRTLNAGDWVLTGTVIRTCFPDVGASLTYQHSVLGEVRADIT